MRSILIVERSVVAMVAVMLLVMSVGLGGCSTAKGLLAGMDKPEARIVSANLQDVNLQQATVLLGVEVSNPYNVALPLTNLDYKLGSGGQQILAGAFDAGTLGSNSIPAKGRKVLQIPASVGFSQVLAALKDVRPGAVVSYTADVGLGVDAPGIGKLDLPRMKKDGSLPIPAVPDISVQNIAWDKLSLDHAGGMVSLKVKNTNQFAADLAKLNYGLSLGGSSVAQGTVNQALSLKPGQEGTIDIPIQFSPQSLGMGAFSMLTGKGSGYELGGDMALSTQFGPLNIPFNKAGQTGFTRR